MVTISAKITQREYDAILYYANCCGETISNLIRKIIISEATFRHGYDGLPDYSCYILTPHGCSSEEEEHIHKNVWNNTRTILGFDKIDSD